MCVVSLQAILTTTAAAGTRVPRIEIRNVSTPMQMFYASGNATSFAGSVIRYVNALHGAGESNIWSTPGGTLTENAVGYWQIPLPQWLVLPSSYSINLSIDGNDTGDILSSLVLGLDDILEFRP